MVERMEERTDGTEKEIISSTKKDTDQLQNDIIDGTSSDWETVQVQKRQFSD